MGKIARIYLPPSAFQEQKVVLDKESSHYLRRVLRLKAGAKFCAFDGESRAWLCSLAGEQANRVGEFEAAVAPHPLNLTLGLALCKGSRFENALEALAELGVARVVPLLTARSERKMPSDQKLERWQKIASSASALAYRLKPLELKAPLHVGRFVAALDGEFFFCHPGGAEPTRALSKQRSSLVLVIGPEGGFTPEEVSEVACLSLGEHNLRVATAAALAAGLALSVASAPSKGM